MYFWDTEGVTNSLHIPSVFIFPPVNIKKAPAFSWFPCHNAKFNMAEHSLKARNGTGSDEGEMASETRNCVYVWSSRQILWGKNVGWRRLRSLPSSLMNGVHFNYTNAAPHVAYYTKGRER